MSEPKFSKEPWSVWTSHHEIADTGDYYDEIGIKDNEGRHLCVMCGDWDDGVMEANATIMAEAPNLYHTLQDVCKKCWDSPQLADGFDGDPLDRKCGECPIRKALAKARGEQ